MENGVFTIERYREGNYYCYDLYLVVNGIESYGEETVVIPTENGGRKVTHVGYYGTTERLEPDCSDYHHMKSNNDIELYHLCEKTVNVSPNVKKIVIPAGITHISSIAFRDRPDLIFEVDQANPVYAASEDGQLIKKS